jgi:hypothetical protein
MTYKRGKSEEISCFEVLDVLLRRAGCLPWRPRDKYYF